MFSLSAAVWSVLLHPHLHVWLTSLKQWANLNSFFLQVVLVRHSDWRMNYLSTHSKTDFLNLCSLPSNWNFISLWLLSFTFNYLPVHSAASFCEFNNFRLYNIWCWLLICLDWEMPRIWGKHTSGWACEGVPKMTELPIIQEKRENIYSKCEPQCPTGSREEKE